MDHFFVRTKEGGSPQTALNIGVFGSGAVMLVVTYFLLQYFGPSGMIDNISVMNLFWATVVGLVSGIFIGLMT